MYTYLHALFQYVIICNLDMSVNRLILILNGKLATSQVNNLLAEVTLHRACLASCTTRKLAQDCVIFRQFVTYNFRRKARYDPYMIYFYNRIHIVISTIEYIINTISLSNGFRKVILFETKPNLF